MQGVNNAFAVFFDKTDSVVFAGPASIFWTAAVPPCTDNPTSAPLFRYDRDADRWVVTQTARQGKHGRGIQRLERHVLDPVCGAVGLRSARNAGS
jgi:hypothetical protein